MRSLLPDIISLTTMCTAGCSHCPYSNPELPKLFLDTSSIKHIANTTSSSLIILTGGEPLLHPAITSILVDLSHDYNPFRLTTGGFIDFSPWVALFHFIYT
ncbi:MAG: radical SAM protein [Parachlamydiaceae bacterium]